MRKYNVETEGGGGGVGEWESMFQLEVERR